MGDYLKSQSYKDIFVLKEFQIQIEVIRPFCHVFCSTFTSPLVSTSTLGSEPPDFWMDDRCSPTEEGMFLLATHHLQTGFGVHYWEKVGFPLVNLPKHEADTEVKSVYNTSTTRLHGSVSCHWKRFTFYSKSFVMNCNFECIYQNFKKQLPSF